MSSAIFGATPVRRSHRDGMFDRSKTSFGEIRRGSPLELQSDMVHTLVDQIAGTRAHFIHLRLCNRWVPGAGHARMGLQWTVNHFAAGARISESGANFVNAYRLRMLIRAADPGPLRMMPANSSITVVPRLSIACLTGAPTKRVDWLADCLSARHARLEGGLRAALSAPPVDQSTADLPTPIGSSGPHVCEHCLAHAAIPEVARGHPPSRAPRRPSTNPLTQVESDSRAGLPVDRGRAARPASGEVRAWAGRLRTGPRSAAGVTAAVEPSGLAAQPFRLDACCNRRSAW